MFNYVEKNKTEKSFSLIGCAKSDKPYNLQQHNNKCSAIAPAISIGTATISKIFLKSGDDNSPLHVVL